VISSSRLTREGLVGQHFLTKASRTRALLEAEREKALGYLSFTLSTPIIPISKEETYGLHISPLNLLNRMLIDNMLYEQIVNDHKVVQPVQEDKNKIKKRKTTTFHSKPMEKSPKYKSLSDVIINGHVDHFTDSNKLRINYFIEDLESHPSYSISELQARELANSFAQFNLSNKWRHREDHPSNDFVKMFFDDVSLYIARSKQEGEVRIPSAIDLHNIYKSVLKQ